MSDESTVLPILPSTRPWALHDVLASRRIEARAIAATGPNVLMQRAGLAVARLARAIAPHARRPWIACGPGNNGGDGMVAACWLQAQGCEPLVTLTALPESLPDDARQAYVQAIAAGVTITRQLPESIECDLCIDALLGLGASRSPEGGVAQAISRLNRIGAPILAVDLPSGLAADSGGLLGDEAVRATHTLALLTLKAGLFTAHGRDHSGRVWLATLGVLTSVEPPSAKLIGPAGLAARAHVQHKGSFGDLIVVGGAAGMSGAAMLAARAALGAGAGRVMQVRLDESLDPDPGRPEVMPRLAQDMLQASVLARSTVVCGCGGGESVRPTLPVILHRAARLVLDADALNAVAADPALRSSLRSRRARGLSTVVTPHPLEAARLLGVACEAVQADRLSSAGRLADDLGCTVVLKGSGTIVTDPGGPPAVNPTGNARLASAGSGDVLAGWLGGLWAQQPARSLMQLACAAVWQHGRAAEVGHSSRPLRAADLIDAMVAVSAGA